jgi:hypothetical protein
MSSGKRIGATVGAAAVAVAALAYLALPLVRTEAAGIACGLTVPGNGTYAVEWKPFPLAHWECTATPEGEQTRTTDLGWWP